MKCCSYCGRDNEDDAIRCPECGTAEFVVAIPYADSAASPSVEFIRLFFKSPKEEEFAVRCAQFLAKTVGEPIKLLRSDTKWSEISQWVGSSLSRESLLLTFALKKEFGAYPDDLMTFRDFVEYICCREHNAP